MSQTTTGSSKRSLGARMALDVAIVDGSGNQITTFGGTGGTSSTDRDAFTPGTTQGTGAMGAYEASPTTVADGKLGLVGITTNRELKVSVTSGGTAGTQYTEGDTDSTITGTALMLEDAANILIAATGNVANGLDVDVTRSALPTGAATAANQATIISSVQLIDDPIATIGATPLMRVALFNAADTQVTSFGGGTEYTEDAVSAANPVGGMLIARRRDTLTAAEVSTDGDVIALNASNKGALYVTGEDLAAISANAEFVSNAYNLHDVTWTAGDPLVIMVGAQFDDTATDGVDEDDAAALRVSANRNLYTTIRDSAGNERGLKVDASGFIGVTDGAGSLTVDNGGTFAVQEADGANTTLGAKADAKSTATDTTAVTAMSVLKQISASVQAPPSQAVTNAGTFAVQATLQAASGVDIGKLTANQSVNLAQVGGTNTVNGGVAGSQSVGGTVATNVAITANPINLGAQAVSSENSAATTARQVQLVADLVGKLIVLPYANPENFVSGAITSAMTGTTTTSLIASPGGSLRNYITQITVSNAHATVGTDVIIQDGSGGTTLYTIPAAAVYGGATVTFPTPLRQPTTATAIFCANVTTGASTKVSASGYKGL